jgi:membrane protein DedA with SNARE-associated domain
MLDSLILFFTNYGYFAVFGILLLCGFGLPVPEDITLVAGGVICGLACPENNGIWEALVSCPEVHIMLAVAMAGVLIGDLTMFTLGRVLGMRITEHRWFRRILSEKRFAMVQGKVAAHGKWIVFAARFMPGLRSPIFVVTGITRTVGYLRFILIDGSAALISVPIWVYLGFLGSQNRTVLLHWIKKGQIGSFVFIGAIIAVFAAKYLIKRFRSKKK